MVPHLVELVAHGIRVEDDTGGAEKDDRHLDHPQLLVRNTIHCSRARSRKCLMTNTQIVMGGVGGPPDFTIKRRITGVAGIHWNDQFSDLSYR